MTVHQRLYTLIETVSVDRTAEPSAHEGGHVEEGRFPGILRPHVWRRQQLPQEVVRRLVDRTAPPHKKEVAPGESVRNQESHTCGCQHTYVCPSVARASGRQMRQPPPPWVCHRLCRHVVSSRRCGQPAQPRSQAAGCGAGSGPNPVLCVLIRGPMQCQ